MPGTIIFKPIQANLTHNTSHIVEMDPYCQITLGSKQVKGEACQKGGRSPHWNDSITLQTIEEPKCLIEIKDKGTLMSDSDIGSCEIDLKEIEKQGQVLRWYTLQYQDKPAGEILLEATFKASTTSDIIHNNIETQMGLGLAGLTNPHLGELAGVTNPPGFNELPGVANPHRSESVQQPLEKGTHQNDIDLGWPEHKVTKHTSLPASSIRSNDLDVPNNRDQLTRPDKDLASYIQNKKEEHVTNFSSVEPEQHLGRVFSHQPLTHTTPPIHEGHKDKDWYHCDHKEKDGLDLTSEFGPHTSGYDKDLWKLPDNLKDVKENPTSK